MFSQACVKNSFQEGDVCTPLGRHPLPRADPQPRQTATAADGTHPTGMHSCFVIILGRNNGSTLFVCNPSIGVSPLVERKDEKM